jgi:hypothetical protein
MVTIGIDGTQTHLLARLLQQLDRADAMPAKPVITVVRTLHLQDRRFGMLVSRPQMGMPDELSVGSAHSQSKCQRDTYKYGHGRTLLHIHSPQ